MARTRQSGKLQCLCLLREPEQRADSCNCIFRRRVSSNAEWRRCVSRYFLVLPGASVLLTAGLDGRISNGNISGFLQANTYISGLSGGSWLIGAIAVHDFATIDTMRNDYWHLLDNLVAPSGFISLVTFYDDIYDQVQQKADAGFET